MAAGMVETSDSTKVATTAVHWAAVSVARTAEKMVERLAARTAERKVAQKAAGMAPKLAGWSV
jgi:hypothetical protein